MTPEEDLYKDGEVIGVAIKMIGSLLRPFVTDKELLAIMDQADGSAAPNAFFPVKYIISLFQVAAKNELLERIASNLAISSLPFLLQQEDVHTPFDVLTTLVNGFPSHHRGFVGHKSIREINPNQVELKDATYVPCDYTIPLYKKTLEGFGAQEIVVDHPKERCKKEGAAACRILFTWTDDLLVQLRKNS